MTNICAAHRKNTSRSNMSNAGDSRLIAKVVMVGDAGVGKSCIVHRIINNVFTEHSATTVGANHHTHVLHIDADVVEMRLWDTAGQERFRSFVPMYFRDAMASIVVFDITDRQSFESAQNWVHMVQKEAKDSVVAIALAGSKCDLVDKRAVTEAESKEFVEKNGLLYLEVSSKTGTNVNELFFAVGQKILQEYASKAEMAPAQAEAAGVDIGATEKGATSGRKCGC